MLSRLPFLRARRAPVLAILHQASSCPGTLPAAFAAAGVDMDVRRPRFGDPLPSTLARHSGVVVLGGPMSANDPDDWLRREIDWLSVPLREGAPLLGICLGAQMLARHLGAKVYVRADGRAQVGHHRIDLTDIGRSILGVPPRSEVFQWHREGFTVPEGGRLLAFDEHFAQGFSYGDGAVGLQFHPEADECVMRRWMSEDPAAERLPGARPFASVLPSQAAVAKSQARWLSGFVSAWLARDRRENPLALGQEVPDRAAAVNHGHAGQVALTGAE